MFVGIDGCADGWVTVSISDFGFVEAALFTSFRLLMDGCADAKVIAVDMPLALVEKGDREADKAAREFLKGQSSSVFSAPPRPVLAAKDYEEAREISLRVNGKSISKQAFAIVPKIIEVREHIGNQRVHEVHPEVSFRLLNCGNQLSKKKTWGGLHSRLALLRSVGIELPQDLGGVNHVGIDDVVDAAVAAWSARRIAAGEARSYPAETKQKDRSGRVVEIRA